MGGGGGKGSTPTLINDNLRSKQFYRVLDIISEGPIYGPVDQDHLSSFRVNKTPVTGTDGAVNIPGVSVAWRPGSADQSPINGFNTVEATVIVNAEFKKDTPLVRTVTDSEVTRVRFNLGVNGLVEQDNKSNQKNTSVTMVIETRTGNGAYQIAKTVTITGKISGEFLEAHTIDAPGVVPFDIRVRRITDDSTSDLLRNGTIWNSYTEIIDDNLSYPYTAVCGAVIDRDQYTDTPSRTYHLRGIICSVPDNYDPFTRKYTGIWTGGFKQSWTNNPAWIFRELVKNTRFGLARWTGYVDTDDGTLYAVSQFCDELVDDGYGGKEPRFTLNAYLAEQRPARDILDDIAGMFRGMAVWDGLRYSVMIDRPQDPVSVVTNANVVDGKFTYSSLERSKRYNAVVISWTDPDNGWEQVKEYYSDDALISSSGVYRETTVEAFGCTSRGQARRLGKYIVETAKLESKKVKFRMARDAIRFLPGDIITIADNNYAGARIGGRVISSSGADITVDAELTEYTGAGGQIYLMGADGKFLLHEIARVSGRIVTLKSVPAWVGDGTVFSVSTGEIRERLFRIMAISEDENNSIYSISATLHNPNKQAIVDDGAVFETPNDSLNGYRVPNVENLKIINTNSETVQVTATWETATTTKKLAFELYVYTLDGKLVAQYETDLFRYDFYGLDAGSYTLGVRGRNENGMKGVETQVSLIIGAPAAPASVQWVPGLFSALMVPVMPMTTTTDTFYEFWWAGENPITDISTIEDTTQFLGRGTQWNVHGLKASTRYYAYVRTKNAFGVSDFFEVSGEASADIPGMIDLIDEAIRDSEAFDHLSGNIDTNVEAILQNALNLDSSVNHQFRQMGEVRADVITVRTAVADVNHALASLEDQIQAQIGDLTSTVKQKLTATVKSDGTAKAFYDVGLQIKRGDQYYKSGMSIGIEPDGNSYKSTMAFNADQFGIYTGSAGSYQLAFAAINGQVFLRSALIQDGSIDNAKIGNFIQSVNYSSGTTGWRLDKNGTFENNGFEAVNGRMVQTNNQISVYDGNGVLRVRMGKLS